MKTITEKELLLKGRAPHKTRISLKDGTKQIYFYSDQEILELVKTGKTTIPKDAEWIDVIKE